MDRYIINGCEIALAKKITVILINRPTTEEDKKNVSVYTGDLISILYTENMADVGKKDKIYRGRILDVVYKPTAHIKAWRPNASYARENDYLEVLPYNMVNNNISCEKKLVGQGIDWDHIYIKMDISTAHNSEVKLFRVSHILDINDVDYEYQPDNPEILECTCNLKIEEDIDHDPVKDIEVIVETVN